MSQPDDAISGVPPKPLDESITAQPPAGGKPTQVRWLVLVLACAVSWLLYVHRYAWGVIKPSLLEEYPELKGQLGWLDTAFQVTYAIGQVPGGLAGDIWGPRVVLSLSLLAWSGTVAALAGGVGLVSFAGIRSLFGLAQAGTYPCLSKVTRSWFPLSSRTTAQGLIASLSGRAGGACASLIVATLLIAALGLDWREAMVVIAAAGVVLAVAIWLLFRDRPSVHPWVNQAEVALIDTGTSAAPATGKPRFDYRLANLVTLGALLIYAACSTFVDQLFVYWVPLFLREAKQLSPGEMGVYASLPLWGGAFGGLVGGVLNDWLIRQTGNRRWSRCAVAFTGKFLAAVLLAASVFVDDGRNVALVLMVAKFFGDWSLSTIWGTVTDISGRAAGTIFGVVNMAGAIASIPANPLIEKLYLTYDWDDTFFFLAGVFLLAAVAWLFIDANRRMLAEDQ